MSMLQGSVNLKLFYFLDGSKESLREAMAAKPVMPDESVMGDPALGFCDVKELAGYNYAVLRQSQRKVDTKALKEAVAKEIERRKAEGIVVNKATKKEIREECYAALLPMTKVTHTDIELVWKTGDTTLYTTAVSQNAQDRLAAQLFLVQQQCVAVCDVTVAMTRSHFDIREYKAVGFSKDIDPSSLECNVEAEFLTWLWNLSETQAAPTIDGEELRLMIEGPLTLTRQDANADVTVLKGDKPTVSVESGVCLKAGKLLTKARLTIVKGEGEWFASASLRPGFVFGSLRVPTEANLDPASAFQNRMAAIEAWAQRFLGLYDRFLKVRDVLREDMMEWVDSKTGEG